MSSLHKTKYVFKHSPASHVLTFNFFAKVVLLKVVYPLNIRQHTKFHGPTLTFAFTSAV
jgi:hypothetical protein